MAAPVGGQLALGFSETNLQALPKTHSQHAEERRDTEHLVFPGVGKRPLALVPKGVAPKQAIVFLRCSNLRHGDNVSSSRLSVQEDTERCCKDESCDYHLKQIHGLNAKL